MIDAHFVFRTRGFIDSPEVLADNVNGISGHALASWLAGATAKHGFLATEVWPEEHGWAVELSRDGQTYLATCSIESDEADLAEAHVCLTKHRSVWERVRGRSAFEKSEAVVGHIQAALESSVDVEGLSLDI
ncbi:MAG: hypothetical protein RLZ98_1123 [Pseudomonadota bacterium]|jgi:hypothetical protein